MLKPMPRPLPRSPKSCFPELPAPRLPPKPLPEAALRPYEPPTLPLRGSTIGPMWRDTART